MSEKFERRLTAIFNADAVGYSRLMRDDEASTVRTITAHFALMTTLVEHHRGRVVNTPGDNILAEFASVVDAVECALEVQAALKSRNAQLPDHRRMEFRIGINLGDVPWRSTPRSQRMHRGRGSRSGIRPRRSGLWNGCGRRA